VKKKKNAYAGLLTGKVGGRGKGTPRIYVKKKKIYSSTGTNERFSFAEGETEGMSELQ